MAKKLGGRLLTAHQQHAATPVEVGNAKLPDGIENGIAQLDDIRIGEYKEGGNKGQPFFMARAVVKEPQVFNGQNLLGRSTQVGPIPLCDTKDDKGNIKKPFADHYADFLNHLKLLGVDTAAQQFGNPEQVDAFINAALAALKSGKPHFSFRTWKGKKKVKGHPKYNEAWDGPNAPEPRVNEEWGMLCEYNGVGDHVLNGVAPAPDAGAMQPDPFTEPPQNEANGTQVETDPADIVAALVEMANGDPENKTPDGISAKQQLEDLALQAGATADMVKSAPGWDEVGQMALGNMPEVPAAPVDAGPPAVGGKFKFHKRDSKGNPLVNKEGKGFPPLNIEILTVDVPTKVVTAKTPDGKTLNGMNKKPVVIKWEWLEPA